MTKDEIRKKMRDQLKGYDETEPSLRLCANLSSLIQRLSLNDCGSSDICAVSKFFPGEPDLTPMLKNLKAERVYLPTVTSADRMTFCAINIGSDERLVSGPFGISEPPAGSEELNLDDSRALIILVPGLAFDLKGNRLGRGKGYYDRFIKFAHSHTKRRVLTIGLCWSWQIIDRVPIEPHDAPVDVLCHENGYELISSL